MKICRLSSIHVRFEPEVDQGTTYAFNFARSKLAIGREKMYRLIMAVPLETVDLKTLCAQLIEADPGERAYADEGDLLKDLLRLVDAEVLGVKPSEAGAALPT